jgi:hypothetical protein
MLLAGLVVPFHAEIERGGINMQLAKAIEGFGVAFLADGKSADTLVTPKLFLSRAIPRPGVLLR